ENSGEGPDRYQVAVQSVRGDVAAGAEPPVTRTLPQHTVASFVGAEVGQRILGRAKAMVEFVLPDNWLNESVEEWTVPLDPAADGLRPRGGRAARPGPVPGRPVPAPAHRRGRRPPDGRPARDHQGSARGQHRRLWAADPLLGEPLPAAARRAARHGRVKGATG